VHTSILSKSPKLTHSNDSIMPITLLDIPFEVVDIIFSFVPSLGLHVSHRYDLLSLKVWHCYMTTDDIIIKYRRETTYELRLNDRFLLRDDLLSAYIYYVCIDNRYITNYPIDAFNMIPKNKGVIYKILSVFDRDDQTCPIEFIRKTVDPSIMRSTIRSHVKERTTWSLAMPQNTQSYIKNYVEYIDGIYAIDHEITTQLPIAVQSDLIHDSLFLRKVRDNLETLTADEAKLAITELNRINKWLLR